jgi:pimeloyl-ACP methyl ester carboxylesterase
MVQYLEAKSKKLIGGAKEMTSKTPKEGYVTSDHGTRIYYRDWQGGSPAIVFLHGLSANRQNGLGLADHLAEKYRFITPEFRGRGLSDKPPAGNYGYPTHAKDIANLIKELNAGPAIIVGHSQGAFVGAILAAEYPGLVSKLVLIDGGATGEELTEETFRAQAKNSIGRLMTVYPSWESYVDFWKQTAPYTTNPWTSYFEEYLRADVVEQSDGTVKSGVSVEAVEEDLTYAFRVYKPEDFLPRIKAPALVLHAPIGLIDPASPMFTEKALKRVVDLLPKGRFVTIEGANHFSVCIYPKQLAQVADEIESFISE